MKLSKIVSHNSTASHLMQLPTTHSKSAESTPHTQKAAKALVSKAPIKKKTNLHAEHVPSDEMDLLISMVNSEDLGWKADECKLQKHHEMYSKCQEVEDVQLLQIDE